MPPEPVAEPVEVVLPEPEPAPAPAAPTPPAPVAAPDPEPIEIVAEPKPVARRKARIARPRKRDDGSSNRGMRVRY